jgi:dTDP-4-dehydrorhamnose 3,5-epimerase
MEIRPLEIPGPVLIVPKKFQDERGFLSETFVDEWFRANVAQTSFVQDNHTHSVHAGTIRGIHFQIPPRQQGKLVRALRGAIWDMAVDLRAGSPSFGRYVGVELSCENWMQLWIPPGFGHGFCTLTPDTEVCYKMTARYDPGSERAIVWNDPDLAIEWPIRAKAPILSERDKSHPRLKELPTYFEFSALS